MNKAMLILLALCACAQQPSSNEQDAFNAQYANAQASLDELNGELQASDAALLSPAGFAERERAAAQFEAELPDRIRAVRDRTRRLAEIERACLNSPQMPGWDCGFGGLDDALRWEWEHQRRAHRP